MINSNFNTHNPNWWAPNSFPDTNFLNNPNSGRVNNSLFGSNMTNTSPEFRHAMLSLARNADTLASSLNFMRGIGRNNASSPFRTIQATSTDTDIVVLRSENTRPLTSVLAHRDMSVDVIQLAAAQRNEGNALAAAGLAADAGFSAGDHRISIQVGDRQFDFNFSVSATDTNQDVQNRIASAVNARNIGVTASISTDSAAGTSTLTFASRETGQHQAEGQPNFTVSSTLGNAVAIAGGNKVTQAGQNAQFRVNHGFTGALQSSRSNDVELGFGISATLSAVGSADITRGRDETGQINAFRHMVNSFNSLMGSAREIGSGSRLERELSDLVRSNSASLRRLGITINDSGRMQIDEDRMQQAAERGDLERFVNRDRVGANFGFMNRLTRTANNVSRNPGAYMAQVNNPNDWLLSNPRMLNQMNRLAGMGMLFDSFM